MGRGNIKREIDLQTMTKWIDQKASVLDLGCGRGIFLEYLKQTRDIYGIGVDRDVDKITSCVKRGVNAYQGDITEVLSVYDDNSFDWVILSRMLHEIDRPQEILSEAARVGKQVAIGFVNYGFWETRINTLIHGQKPRNDVYPHEWHNSHPTNPLTINDFENFCKLPVLKLRKKCFLINHG